MILLFTSSHCIWCGAVKQMMLDVTPHLKRSPRVCEINIDEHKVFADVFGISVVPTLVYKGHTLSGFPDSSDLYSFILQSIAEGCSVSRAPRELPQKAQLYLAPTIRESSNPPEKKDKLCSSTIVDLV